MSDSFVDVTYRGLEVGKRLKLRDVRTELGYLEVPLPMPVGTKLMIDAGEGVVIEALVASVHEQVAGSDLVPGMRIRPTLSGKAKDWWQAHIDRVAEAAEAAAAAAKPQAVPAAAPEAVPEAASEAPVEEEQSRSKKNGKRKRNSKDADVVEAAPRPTVVMSTEAVEAALAAHEAPADDGIVDDGKRTEMMPAIDISQLEGMDSGGVVGSDDEDTEITIEADEADDTTNSGPISTGGNGKPKRTTGGGKRRKKR